MIASKSRSDILLEERIAQIDDINFDKIYDIEEFASKQIETFDDVDLSFNNQELQTVDNFSEPKAENAFEMELQPNEFLDNYVWNNSEQEEEVSVVKQQKFKVANKPLLFTFTSIAVLLCILFIYNVFVINSLEASVGKTTALNANNASFSCVYEQDNNYIMLENSNKIEIENNENENQNKQNNSSESQVTNWFDVVCNYVNSLFGGKY